MHFHVYAAYTLAIGALRTTPEVGANNVVAAFTENLTRLQRAEHEYEEACKLNEREVGAFFDKQFESDPEINGNTEIVVHMKYFYVATASIAPYLKTESPQESNKMDLKYIQGFVDTFNANTCILQVWLRYVMKNIVAATEAANEIVAQVEKSQLEDKLSGFALETFLAASQYRWFGLKEHLLNLHNSLVENLTQIDSKLKMREALQAFNDDFETKKQKLKAAEYTNVGADIEAAKMAVEDAHRIFLAVKNVADIFQVTADKLADELLRTLQYVRAITN